MTPGLVGRTLGYVANEVVPVLDVDGVVRQIDVESILDRVDLNKLLDRVDLNRQLDRIDFDRLLNRVDVNDVVLRSDLGAIIARSMTGVFSEMMDSVRRLSIVFDTWIYLFSGYFRCQKERSLPPGPDKQSIPLKDSELLQETRLHSLAVEVQGRYAGIASRGIAIGIDTFLVGFTFAVWMALVGFMIMLITDEDEFFSFRRGDNRFTKITWALYWFSYFFLSSLLGKSIGMAAMGLKSVNTSTGQRMSPLRAFLRTALLPISVFFWFMVLFGLLRNDGRMFHEIVSCTGMVYKWNAKSAWYRARAEARRSKFESSSLSLPDLLENDDQQPAGNS